MTEEATHTPMQQRSRRVEDYPVHARTTRLPCASPPTVPLNADPRTIPAEVLTPAAIVALQRRAGNRAVQQIIAVQRVRTQKKPTSKQDNVRAKLAKERKKRKWKDTKLWPEQAVKGRVLEVTDKYLFRRVGGKGYIDMNKVASNFPAIDGIADGKFRQVKAYLNLGGTTKKLREVAMRNAVARIVAQVNDLSEKCEIAAARMVAHDGRLLRLLLDIHKGRASTKGRTGKAPYSEIDTSKRARKKHVGALPEPFRQEARTQIKSRAADPENVDFDTDGLAHVIMQNMVVVVPDELVAAVTKEVRGAVAVEGGGFTSVQIKNLMDEAGYAASKRGKDDDSDYVG
ncbi:MAG: hypothetical protein ACRDQU_16365 [Pseudonocardiaceae bacterium]